jgi:hypothetical protein
LGGEPIDVGAVRGLQPLRFFGRTIPIRAGFQQCHHIGAHADVVRLESSGECRVVA